MGHWGTLGVIGYHWGSLGVIDGHWVSLLVIGGHWGSLPIQFCNVVFSFFAIVFFFCCCYYVLCCLVLSMPVESVVTLICGMFCVIVVCMTDTRVDV